jgi:tetratricopeptide (TPR) repeat protein
MGITFESDSQDEVDMIRTWETVVEAFPTSDVMKDSATRLAELVATAEREHCFTEAAQLGDIAWLYGEVENLAVPVEMRALWRERIEALGRKVDRRLGELANALTLARACTDEGDCDHLITRIEGVVDNLAQLWGEIETEELRLVLEFPEILSGRYEPHPPHLKELSREVHEASELCLHLGGGAAPSRLVELAAALRDLALRLANSGKPEEAARAADKAVNLLRRLANADPERLHKALGAALAALAQSLLYCGQVEDATVAATEACGLCDPENVPAEVCGLVGSG